MALDELAFSAQCAVDRQIRRLRRGAALTPTHWRLLVVQIDGLTRVLGEALASGNMPFLARLLERHDYRLKPMAVGLPTSTAAFHMAAMYGERPDIPKSLTQTILEVARVGLCLIADPFGEVGHWRWLTIKIGISV